MNLIKRSPFSFLIVALLVVSTTELVVVFHYVTLAKHAQKAVQAEIHNRFSSRTSSTEAQKYISFRDLEKEVHGSKPSKGDL